MVSRSFNQPVSLPKNVLFKIVGVTQCGGGGCGRGSVEQVQAGRVGCVMTSSSHT